jgi:hypothetical protein
LEEPVPTSNGEQVSAESEAGDSIAWTAVRKIEMAYPFGWAFF